VVQAEIAAMAREAGPGGKLPSVLQLRDRFGISTSTLHQILESLERSNQIERRHGQGIYASAHVLQKTIGLVFTGEPFQPNQSPYYGLLIRAFQQQMALRGDSCIVHMMMLDPRPDALPRRRLAHDIESGQVDGLWLVQGSMELLTWVAKFGIPVVHSGEGFTQKLPHVCNMEDHRPSTVHEGLQVALDGLAAGGVRKVGLMHYCPPHLLNDSSGLFKAARIQYEYFVQKAAALGMEFRPDWYISAWDDRVHRLEIFADEVGFAQMRTHWQRWQVTGSAPQGLVFSDEMVARGALAALARAGVRIGEDLQLASLATQGGSALLGFEDQMVRVEFDPRSHVQTALNLLDCLFTGRPPQPADLSPMVPLLNLPQTPPSAK
jgi:DNA-binding LacI/PurR family transcriptional regulator